MEKAVPVIGEAHPELIRANGVVKSFEWNIVPAFQRWSMIGRHGPRRTISSWKSKHASGGPSDKLDESDTRSRSVNILIEGRTT